jgi:phage shock protein E
MTKTMVEVTTRTVPPATIARRYGQPPASKRPDTAPGKRTLSSTVPTFIDRQEVQRLAKQGAQLVEVLPQDEYAEEHLPGAINIPLKTLTKDTVSQLDRNRPVITYCNDHQ